MRGPSVRCAVVVALSCAWVGVLGSTPAVAQPATTAAGPAQAGSDVAKKLYEEGRQAAQRNQWEKARAAYLGAWQLRRHWQIAISLAQAEIKLEQFREAAEHLAYFLREGQDAGESNRKTAQEMLAEARKHIGELTIVANEPGAEIRVDEVTVGKSPLAEPVFVAPGQHVVEARLEGFPTAKETQEVSAGAAVSVEMKLVKAAPIVCPAPEPPKVEVRGGANKGVIIGGLVATAVAGGLGAGFVVASNQAWKESHELEKPMNDCVSAGNCVQRFDKLQHDKVTFAGLAMGSLIGAGALSVGTIIYALAGSSSRPKDGALSRVRVGIGASAVRVTAAW